MKKLLLILLVLVFVILILSSCTPNPENNITFTANVTKMEFIARSWNAADYIDVSFSDGHHLYIKVSQSSQFMEGHQYTVTMDSNSKLISVSN